MEGNYKYILSYIDNNTKVTMEFNAEITIDDLRYRLRDFLASSSWDDKLIKRIIKGL